jgi:hypothetical protein
MHVTLHVRIPHTSLIDSHTSLMGLRVACAGVRLGLVVLTSSRFPLGCLVGLPIRFPLGYLGILDECHGYTCILTLNSCSSLSF